MTDTPSGRTSQPALPLVDDPAVSETYGDSFVGLSLSHGNVNLTFATVRADYSREPVQNRRVVSSRLVVPAAVVIEMHRMLGQLLTDMEKKGVIQRVPAPAASRTDVTD
jgi:hypothetical protein